MPESKTSRVRQALRALSTVLIVSGAMLIADAGLTLVWQEPISAVYAKSSSASSRVSSTTSRT